jgi:hypothetical protein
MRFIAAIVGILVSLPTFALSMFGTHAFVSLTERAWAMAVALEAGALFFVSALLIFTSSIQRLQGALLIVTVVTIALILVVLGIAG